MVPKRKQIRETLARLDLWVDRTSLLLDAMKMTFANGDTKTMAFEDVVAERARSTPRTRSRGRSAAQRELAARRYARCVRAEQRMTRRPTARGRTPPGSAPASIMRCVRRSARSRNSAFRRSTSRSHCQQAFAPLQVQHRAAPGLAVQLEEPRGPSAGSHSRWCMSKCDQRRARSVGRISSKYAVPGSGVRIVKPA